MNEVMIVVLVGVLGGIANLLLSYVKKWELLGVFTLALLFPIIGVLLVDALYGNMGWFGAIVMFASMIGIVGLTAISVVAVAVQTITSTTEKEETTS
ncbi:hypothetical protein GAH_01252 [Geoglobus ahangari]|uniref:Uncharacterized protein n=1 Tax=Geoglobus ahangari TaxID=113653 RepID=A0A0F7IHD6_9EURY|nr:hypothetical protein [Geoglobus ahangari]AKG91444.1 hypothetical protein GAH_01252 [Geoglobus ahangari]NOY11613.1 hypothetical protein [Archaeoglobi archaeon]